MTSDHRIEALERRVRWLTAVCVFLALALVILYVRPYLEPPPGSTDRSRPDRPDLRVKSLAIPDSTGVVRLQTGLYLDGTPFLRLNGSDGRERLGAVVRADGQPEIRLSDPQERGSTWIDLDESGRARIRLSDGNGEPLVTLLGRGDGRPGLVMWDGATRETLFAAPAGRRRQAAASR